MSLTSSPLTWYDKGIKNLSKFNPLTDTIKIILCTSSYIPNAATHEYYDVSITNELTTANGYTAGGQTLTTKTLTEITAGTWGFDSDDPSWTASGAGITAHLYALYNDTPASNKPLIAYGYLNYNGGSPASVTTVAGFPLTIQVPTNGWYTMVKQNGA